MVALLSKLCSFVIACFAITYARDPTGFTADVTAQGEVFLNTFGATKSGVALFQTGAVKIKGRHGKIHRGDDTEVALIHVSEIMETRLEDSIDYSTDCKVVRSMGDAIIDSVRLANKSRGGNIKLACAIYTYRGNRRQLAETYHTWGKSCDTFLAYSDEKWLIPNSSGVETIPLRQGLSEKVDIWQSVQKMWTHMATELDARTLDFDFVTFSGDDALFIVPNLRAYLAELPPLTSANTLQTEQEFRPTGFELIGGSDAESGFPWIGGAGYVINRQAIASRLLSTCDPEVLQRRASEEDLLTSTCLFAAGVFPRDTRDDEGKVRFCRTMPGLPCNQSGGPIPSNDVVLFHYLDGQKRQAVVDRLYRCRGL